MYVPTSKLDISPSQQQDTELPGNAPQCIGTGKILASATLSSVTATLAWGSSRVPRMEHSSQPPRHYDQSPSQSSQALLARHYYYYYYYYYYCLFPHHAL
jgi:hypothetical protein